MTTALHTEEPAVAVAMGLCLAARTLDPQRQTRRHPGPCGWCDFPAEELDAAVREFNAWAQFDDRRGTTARHATRMFAERPGPERERLIVEAQAFLPDPVPIESRPMPEAADAPVAQPPIQTATAEQMAIAEEEYLPWKR
jgi:hypothetical protein